MKLLGKTEAYTMTPLEKAYEVNGNYEAIKQNYYNKGLDDAWELLRKVSKYSYDKMFEIFGNASLMVISEKYTPQEAIEKLKAYEEAQKQIEVGDVVQYEYNKIVVTNIFTDDDIVIGFDEYGNNFAFNIENVKKTGKHIDIKAILDQIGE